MIGYIHPSKAPTSRRSSELEIKRTLKERTEQWFHAIGQHTSQAAKKIGIDRGTVYAWRRVGRISPWGALVIERHYPKFKAAYLRPDVVDWDDIKQRSPGIF